MSLTETSDFPGAQDIFPDLSAVGADKLNTVGKEHDALHDKVSRAVAALERLWLGMGNNVNVMAHGAVDGGSAATNTAALNAARAEALSSGRPGEVFIPPGVTLPVTPGGVIGASNILYTGGGRITTTQTTAGALITFPVGSTNFGVVGLNFESPNDNIVAVYVKSAPSAMSNDGRIIDNRCTGCTLVDTNDITVFYASITTHATTGNVTRDLTITGNRGVCTSAVSTKAFIFGYYLMGAVITGNRARGYASGIQWWGGDASPAADGAIANERRCGDMTIGNNKFYDMTIGGTWGSMGRDITVTGDIVENIGDVGFDCEGGQNVTFGGCVARNCTNGGIATFAFNRNVRFDGVTVETDTLNGWVAEIKNVASSHDNHSVTVTGSFTCTNGVGVFIWEVTKLAKMDLTLNSVAFSSYFNGQGDTTGKIVQTMDATLATAFTGVYLGATHGCLCEVDVTSLSSVSHPAGSRAITVGQAVASTTKIHFAVRGWGATPVKWEMLGTAPGSVPMAFFSGDMYDGTGIDRAESSSNSTKSIMFIEPGKMTNGLGANSIPSAVPVAGYWNVGQRIFYGAPTASGKIGSVCVTAGAPGTWKDFGPIDA